MLAVASHHRFTTVEWWGGVTCITVLIPTFLVSVLFIRAGKRQVPEPVSMGTGSVLHWETIDSLACVHGHQPCARAFVLMLSPDPHFNPFGD